MGGVGYIPLKWLCGVSIAKPELSLQGQDMERVNIGYKATFGVQVARRRRKRGKRIFAYGISNAGAGTIRCWLRKVMTKRNVMTA